jgi:hypothetical protein
MSRLVLVLLVLVSSGCSHKNTHDAGAPGPGAASESAASANRHLAYEHTLAIDAEPDKVDPLFESAQAACRAATAESCAILEAQVTSGEYASARLKFRTTPKGVRDLIALLFAQGQVASRSTSAEDLAGPIEDSAKKIAMLTDYREKLEALRGRSNSDVDSLIKLARELAQVQSELESLAGSRAALIQRVETELLNVSITSYDSRSFWSPIGSSLADFGDNFSEAIATFITVLPYLIPWALLLFLGFWIWRKRRLRKREP